MSIYDFEIGGTKFQGKPLDPEASLDGFAILAPAIGKVIDGLDPSMLKDSKVDAIASIIQKSIGTMKELPKFMPFFLPQYQVYLEQNGDARWVPLASFKGDVFKGNPAIMVAWLIASLNAEYRGFLAENVSVIFKDLAALLGLAIKSKSTGRSGD